MTEDTKARIKRLAQSYRTANYAERETARTELHAAIDSIDARGGEAVVPVDPTEAMKLAGGHANSEWLNDNAPIGEKRYAMPMPSVWSAMLAASPIPTPEPQDGRGSSRQQQFLIDLDSFLRDLESKGISMVSVTELRGIGSQDATK